MDKLQRLEKFKNLVQKSNKILENLSFDEEKLIEVDELWKEQDQLLSQIKEPTMEEIVLDLQTLHGTGTLIENAVRNLDVSNTNIDIMQLAGIWQRWLSENTCSIRSVWEKLETVALPITGHGVILPFNENTFKSISDSSPVVNKKVKMQQLSQKATSTKEKKKMPTKVECMENSRHLTEYRIHRILRCLQRYYSKNNNEPINFYKFTLHPTNFMTSIENMHFISFLVKDGLAGLEKRHNVPVIFPISSENSGENDETKKKKAILLTLEMNQWKNLVHELQIQSPMIT